MSEIGTKTEDLHNYPFEASIFRNTFNGYVGKYNIFFFILLFIIFSPFIAYGIVWYLELTGLDITGFLNIWHALGLSNISYELISAGMISFGNLSCGVVSIGLWGSCGVISIGCWGSCGVISISPMSSIGFISLGSSYACGLIAIATGHKKPFVADEYIHGKALGLIAIARHARGVYALSYGGEGEGTYQFSPKRQDPEAVMLFTQQFRKFKRAFVPLS